MWNNNSNNADDSRNFKSQNIEFPNFEEFTSSFNSSQNDDNNFNNTDNNSNPFSNIDMNTILKMKQIMEGMNSKNGNPRSNLLLSLKPYLRPERRPKVDQYIQLLNIENIMENFKNVGGDNKL